MPEDIAQLDEVEADDVVTRTLYVQTHGAMLRSRRSRFVVTIDEQELLSVPFDLVDAVVVIGEVGVTASARSELLFRGVPVVYSSAGGWYRGSLRSGGTVDGDRLRSQIRFADDPERSLLMAQHIVSGKIRNSLSLLGRFAGDDASTVIERMSTLAERCGSCSSMEQLLGIEGAASAAYFGAWPSLLPGWTAFSVRRRSPPPDPVNAALGYGYSLLAGWAEAALVAAKLEPAIGVMHRDHRARPSLALDLMEEFRAPLVDQVVIELFRKGSLTDDSFTTGDEEASVWLTPQGRRTFTAGLEQRFAQHFNYHVLERRVSYRRAVMLQGQQLARCFVNGSSDYATIRWRR